MEELKEQIKAQYGCSPDQKTEAPPSIVFTARTPPCAAIVGIVDAGQGSRGNPSSEVDEFQAFVYLTQLQQALVYSTAASKWRTGKASFANAGFLYWQLNDVWAGPSWSSINYDGSWRALHYAASKFLAPLMVFGKLKILENCSSHCALGTLDALDVWLVNDFSTNVQGSLTVQVIDYMAKSLDDVIVLLSNYSVEAQALNVTLAWQWERVVDRKVQRPSINKSFVKLEFCPHTISTEAGNCAVQYLASTKLQEFESGDTRLKVESVQSCHYNSKKNDNRCFSLVLGATGGIAPWVLLESTVPGTFSDNLLFVVPWDQTRVEFHVSSSVTSLPGVREMEESLRITWLRGSHAAMSPDHHNKVQSRNWFVTWM